MSSISGSADCSLQELEEGIVPVRGFGTRGLFRWKVAGRVGGHDHHLFGRQLDRWFDRGVEVHASIDELGRIAVVDVDRGEQQRH